MPKVQVVSAPDGPLATPLLTYRLPDNIHAAELSTILGDKHRIQVKLVPSNWLNGQRISTHVFNTESDVRRLVKALTG